MFYLPLNIDIKSSSIIKYIVSKSKLNILVVS